MTRFSPQRYLPSLASYNHERFSFSFFSTMSFIRIFLFFLFINSPISLSRHCLLHLDGWSTYARLYPLPDVLYCLLHLVCLVGFLHATLYHSFLYCSDIYIYYVTFYSILWLPIKWNKGGDVCLRVSCESANGNCSTSRDFPANLPDVTGALG